MKPLLPAFASVLALGTVLISPAAMAQEQNDGAEETVDYSKDPSYQAARDFFRMIGADQPRQEDEPDTDQKVEAFIDAWPEGSTLESWDHHYLILEGENYLPVIWSAVTEFVTVFIVEDGYMPSGAMGGKTSSNSNCHDSDDYRVTANGVVRGETSLSVSRADEATVGRAIGQNENGNAGDTYNCPRLLGELSAGTQVMDKDHNVLAEQWFPEGRKGFIADGWVYDDDYISPEDEAAFGEVEFLVITEGGADRTDDPAIRRLPVSRVIVIDYPIMLAEHSDTSGTKQDEGKTKQPYISGTPELPVTVFGRPIVDADNADVDGDGTVDHADISEILKALEDKMDDVLASAGEGTEFLLVHRTDPDLMKDSQMEDEVMERVRSIREALRKRGKLTLVSFGQEAPICNGTDEHCWSLNRSTALYIVND